MSGSVCSSMLTRAAVQGSIRVRLEDGQPGPTIGEWLVSAGLEVNRGALLSAVSAPRRRFPNRRATNPQSAATRALPFQPLPSRGGGGGGGRSGGGVAVKKRHRPDCMCIICKQARRKVGGVGHGAEEYALPASSVSEALLDDGGNGPTPPTRPSLRLGKHAYIDSTPYLPRGCAPPGKAAFSAPSSRSWHPEEWAIYWPLQSDVMRGAAGAGSASDDEPAAAQPPVDRALVRMLQPPGPHASLPLVVRKGTLALLGVRPPTAEDAPRRLGIPSAKDKVLMCRRTERNRLTINKSGIHGWGMTALCNIPQVLTRISCDVRRRPHCVRLAVDAAPDLPLLSMAASEFTNPLEQRKEHMSSSIGLRYCLPRAQRWYRG